MEDTQYAFKFNPHDINIEENVDFEA